MAQVEKTVLIPYSVEQMYALVDAVEHYPEFLPWCGDVDLVSRDAAVTTARLHIDYHGLKQHFTTENHKTYPSKMDIRLKDGPFKHLEGVWHFIALSKTACKIEFRLNYEFSSVILGKFIAPVFSHIADTFVDNFIARAEHVYKVGNQ